MSEIESRFVLSAYRPNGSDSDNPMMAAALATLEGDPDRKAAFEEQVSFDRMVSNALSNLPVPEGLRNQILAGAQLSQEPAATVTHNWFRSPWIAAAAAVIAVGAVTTTLLVDRAGSGTTPTPIASNHPGWESQSMDLLTAVLNNKSPANKLDPGTNAQTWFTSNIGSDVTLPAGLEKMKSVACKNIQTPNGKIALMCFEIPGDGGGMVHLTVHECLKTSPTENKASDFSEYGAFLTATWSDGAKNYMLATDSDTPGADQRLTAALGITTT